MQLLPIPWAKTTKVRGQCLGYGGTLTGYHKNKNSTYIFFSGGLIPH